MSGDALREYDVAYFGASVDSPATNKEFAESLALDYPLLSDADKSVTAAYGVLGTFGVASRTTFYIGKEGKLLFVDRDVSTATHGKAIVARLATLGVAKSRTAPTTTR